MKEMETSEVAGQFVKGLDYPIAKAEIVAAAREANLSTTIQEGLKELPEREYADPQDLIKELNGA